MHAALWKLYRLRVRGSIRSMIAKCNTVRGAAMMVFSLVVIAMMFGPNLAMANRMPRTEGLEKSSETFAAIVPMVMLLYVVMSIVTSMGERAVYFTPSEVDFLFPAPFSRREVLIYKIVGNFTSAAFIALIMPISMIQYLRSFVAGAVGFYLAWLAINSMVMCAQLVAQTIGEAAFTRTRRYVLGGLSVAVAAALGQAASRVQEGSWLEAIVQARHSMAAEIVLAPFTVFARVITAERLVPDALGWTALATIMVIGIYALAIRLDANYLETAVRVSQKIQEMKSRAQRGGIFAMHPKRNVKTTRLPQPPWWGGAGPLIWRQLVQSLRSSRGAMIFVVIILLAMGMPILVGSHAGNEVRAYLPRMVIGLTAYLTFIFSSQAPFGFRSDYERMDVLKSLPFRPLAMAFGQTVVAVVVMTLVQWMLLGATAAFSPGAIGELLIAGLFALPLNWFLFGSENLVFLLFPSPPITTGSEGFLKMGRMMLFMLAKVLVLLASLIVAAIPAGIVFLVSRHVLATAIVFYVALLAPALAMLWLMTWAYERYDVSAGATE